MLMMGRLARFGKRRIWDASEKQARPQEDWVTVRVQTLLLLILVGERAASQSNPAGHRLLSVFLNRSTRPSQQHLQAPSGVLFAQTKTLPWTVRSASDGPKW